MRITQLLPLWFLLFTIGFGWFLLAPLVPALSSIFNISIGAVIFMISEYGLTMVILGILAGWLSARLTIRRVLITSAALSMIGLMGRAFAGNYSSFLLLQTVAAAAYPLSLAPIGAVAQAVYSERSHTIVGASVGILFLGMAMGSLLGPHMFLAWGLRGSLYVSGALSIIALAWMIMGSRNYPAKYSRSLRGVFQVGMLKNWYIGFTVASLSVMFSSIASTMLAHNGLPISDALTYGGEFGGLAFLGSALGAIILPTLFEYINKVRLGLVLTSLLSLASAALLSYYLAYTAQVLLLSILFFIFGFVGNAFWSMALASVTSYVKDPARAGLATSMYSVATNLGVTFIPSLLGSMFPTHQFISITIVSTMMLLALVASIFLKTS